MEVFGLIIEISIKTAFFIFMIYGFQKIIETDVTENI